MKRRLNIKNATVKPKTQVNLEPLSPARQLDDKEQLYSRSRTTSCLSQSKVSIGEEDFSSEKAAYSMEESPYVAEGNVFQAKQIKDSDIGSACLPEALVSNEATLLSDSMDRTATFKLSLLLDKDNEIQSCDTTSSPSSKRVKKEDDEESLFSSQSDTSTLCAIKNRSICGREKSRRPVCLLSNKEPLDWNVASIGDMATWYPMYKPSLKKERQDKESSSDPKKCFSNPVNPCKNEVCSEVREKACNVLGNTVSQGMVCKLDSEGNIVLDQAMSAESEMKLDLDNMTLVAEDLDGIGHTKYSSFLKRKCSGKKWNSIETLHFYRLLSSMGTDFTTMSLVFPTSRSRNDLKAKFKREEKNRPFHINSILKTRRDYSYGICDSDLLQHSDEKQDKCPSSLQASDDRFDPIYQLTLEIRKEKDEKRLRKSINKQLEQTLFKSSLSKSSQKVFSGDSSQRKQMEEILSVYSN